jgi:hypothetical protein
MTDQGFGQSAEPFPGSGPRSFFGAVPRRIPLKKAAPTELSPDSGQAAGTASIFSLAAIPSAAQASFDRRSASEPLSTIPIPWQLPVLAYLHHALHLLSADFGRSGRPRPAPERAATRAAPTIDARRELRREAQCACAAAFFLYFSKPPLPTTSATLPSGARNFSASASGFDRIVPPCCLTVSANASRSATSMPQ